MRKYIGYIIIGFLAISACEKDDFCVDQPLTPNLILRFYDAGDNATFKDVDSLYVWADGKDSIYINATTDSIQLPLNTTDIQTVYKLSSGTTVNTLTITYSVEEDYVSRSCGFRTVFSDLNLTSENTWINSITPEVLTTINSQNTAHVQVFH
jgi:hypothetical protein